MANLKTNPWSFTNADVVAGTVAAISLNADGTVALTTAANLGVNAGDFVTVRNVTNALYNGYYKVLIGAAGTAFTLVPVPPLTIAAGTGTSAAGQVAKCLYTAMIRIEDLSWQGAKNTNDILDVTDRNGNAEWYATAPGPGQQNRGKLFWVDGLTLFEMDSGILIVTIN